MSLICIQDQDEYFRNGTFASVLFQRAIPVHIDPEVDMAYAKQCVEHFNHLSDQMIDKFCEMAIAYCEFMRKEWKEFEDVYPDIVEDIQREIPEKLHGREVLAFLTTPEMYIEPPEEAVCGYSISSACVWEPEHALDWIIRGDKILYVGPCEGMGAWQEEEDYETIF